MTEEQLLMEMKNFDRDSDLFNKSIKALRKDFKDKFVAFKDGKVIANGCTFDELRDVTEKKHIDLGSCVVQFILEKDVLYIL